MYMAALLSSPHLCNETPPGNVNQCRIESYLMSFGEMANLVAMAMKEKG
jgi:hypothetical protein